MTFWLRHITRQRSAWLLLGLSAVFLEVCALLFQHAVVSHRFWLSAMLVAVSAAVCGLVCDRRARVQGKGVVRCAGVP